MAHSIKEGTRYAVVHGDNCAPHPPLNNNCQVTIGQIVQAIKDAGIGLDQDQLTLTFTSASNGTQVPNSHVDQLPGDTTPSGRRLRITLGACRSRSTGRSDSIRLSPCSGRAVTHGINFATAYFPATSQEAHAILRKNTMQMKSSKRRGQAILMVTLALFVLCGMLGTGDRLWMGILCEEDGTGRGGFRSAGGSGIGLQDHRRDHHRVNGVSDGCHLPTQSRCMSWY